MRLYQGEEEEEEEKEEEEEDEIVFYAIQYNITLLPSVNTLIARGMFCGAKYTHHTFTPIIKHLITTTAKKKKKKKKKKKS